MDEITYTATYKGQHYTLALRVCDDGYISNYEYIAVQKAVNARALSEDRFVDGFFAAIIHEIRNESGKEVQQPWTNWNELDNELIDKISEDVFFSFAQKAEKSANSTRYMDLIKSAMLLGLYRTISRNSTSPSSPPAPGTSSSA